MLIAAYSKLSGFPNVGGYFGKLGLRQPGLIVPLVIALEGAAGLALLAEFKMRMVALATGAFYVAAGLIAHSNIANGNQLNHLLKNFALLGDCLAFFASGPWRYSVDGHRAAG